MEFHPAPAKLVKTSITLPLIRAPSLSPATKAATVNDAMDVLLARESTRQILMLCAPMTADLISYPVALSEVSPVNRSRMAALRVEPTLPAAMSMYAS